jgi:ABC-type molybdenum transport system ATPase subunit/photorepair protein PhrA
MAGMLGLKTFSSHPRLCRQLHNLLVKETESADPPHMIRSIILEGDSGSGKTTLVKEMAMLLADHFDRIQYFNFQLDAELTGQWAEFSSTVPSCSSSSTSEIYQQLRHTNFLLIFDHVLSMEMLHKYFPTASYSSKEHQSQHEQQQRLLQVILIVRRTSVGAAERWPLRMRIIL